MLDVTPKEPVAELQVGDTFTMWVEDQNRWKRFVHWVTRKSPPMVKKTFKVESIVTANKDSIYDVTSRISSAGEENAGN